MPAETLHPPASADLITPSVLVLDDERQIHSSLRLRLGDRCRLTSHTDPRQALAALRDGQFDLCFVDVHMPGMDGLEFIEAAQRIDPALGYVILTGYDSEENLRRAIPLQVLEFLAKPLPDRAGFEDRVPAWIAHTRMRRHEIAAARHSGTIIHDLAVARLEREAEFTASAHAREALLQTSTLLTSTHALLLGTRHALAGLSASDDPLLTEAVRHLGEACEQAEAAAAIAEGYFASAYADRESSPALLNTCLEHAVRLSRRLAKASERQQTIAVASPGQDIVLAGLTGMDLLLMLVPALVQSLELTAPGGTLRIQCQTIPRLDHPLEERSHRDFLWVNRHEAAGGAPGVQIMIGSDSPAFAEDAAKAWLRGRTGREFRLSSRGLLHGVQMARGLLGLAVSPPAERFVLILCLRL